MFADPVSKLLQAAQVSGLWRTSRRRGCRLSGRAAAIGHGYPPAKPAYVRKAN